MDLIALKNKLQQELQNITQKQQIEEFYRKYLGKKGEFARFFADLGKKSKEERKILGEQANKIKKEIEGLFQQKNSEIRHQQYSQYTTEKIDITRPGLKVSRGHLHPLTLVIQEACSIFQTMGFEIVLGPELETDWYNFGSLNFPPDHPARDMQDTFWLKEKESAVRKNPAGGKSNKLVMRTHTSAMQVRYMEKHNPPLRIVVPGKVFRNETTDAKHEVQFYQLEGLMVDKNISAANFKAVIEKFLNLFFKTNIAIRLRPGFFPFTEPSFEIDAKMASGKWMELMGAGMVHPNVFKAAALVPKEWTGFAFGVGIDRLAMIRYKINDIRLFYQNDLRFLTQF